MSRDLDTVLASIEGALADAEFPDAMRWSPEPERVEHAGVPYTENSWPLLPIFDRSDAFGAFSAEYSRDLQRRQAEAARQAFDTLGEYLRSWSEACSEACRSASEQLTGWHKALREADVLPAEPPTDPRARALWLRQHRNTGPDRQVQHRPRPRRHT